MRFGEGGRALKKKVFFGGCHRGCQSVRAAGDRKGRDYCMCAWVSSFHPCVWKRKVGILSYASRCVFT